LAAGVIVLATVSLTAAGDCEGVDEGAISSSLRRCSSSFCTIPDAVIGDGEGLGDCSWITFEGNSDLTPPQTPNKSLKTAKMTSKTLARAENFAIIGRRFIFAIKSGFTRVGLEC
jgi:hypothetical protein